MDAMKSDSNGKLETTELPPRNTRFLSNINTILTSKHKFKSLSIEKRAFNTLNIDTIKSSSLSNTGSNSRLIPDKAADFVKAINTVKKSREENIITDGCKTIRSITRFFFCIK